MRERKEVIKHSAAVHIQNNITLLQRRAWNVLLAHAYDELPREEEYTLRVQDLMRVLEFDSKNEAYLKEALEALVGCKVEWNILGKDGTQEWGVTTLLAQAKIRGGVCTYAYSPELRRRLHNPRMYARINLSMQNKFGSKHAQTLWEVCVDYMHETKHFGETPFIPLSLYRRLMGIAEEMYPKFKEFNRRVIKDPVEEINRVTDFQVTAEFQRKRRKVEAVKFKARRVLQLPEPAQPTLPLFPDLEDMPLAVKELKEAGLSPHDAWEVWQAGFGGVESDKRPGDVNGDPELAFARYIREKIDLLKQRQEAGKLGSRTGFLLKAIRHNYANPEFAEAERRLATQQARQEKQARERRRARLADKKAQLEKGRRADVHACCRELIEATPALAEEALEAVLAEEPSYLTYCLPERSAAENYREATLLWMCMDTYLEERYPEHFSAVRDTYDTRLKAIATQLTELEQALA